MSLTAALLDRHFGGAVPPAVAALVQDEVADALVEDFKVGPILPGESESRPVRVAVSDEAEPARWAREVQARWPGAAGLLEAGPPGCRRMVDTDGREAVVYLDDLQDHPVRPPRWLSHPLMCLTWASADGSLGVISRHPDPPWEALPPALRAAAAPLRGAPGLWGLRWTRRKVESLLWVSECRWRGNAAEGRARLGDLLAAPARWRALDTWLSDRGVLAYPDAVDVFADGRVDLTVGMLRPGAGGRDGRDPGHPPAST